MIMNTMEHVKTFLDTSTIHGMSWISSNNRFARFFWILIVLGGFSWAGYMIHQSFYNWQQSPITTTLETLPITDITFPNVVKLLLIFAPSFNRVPFAPVDSARSEPARSTRDILLT